MTRNSSHEDVQLLTPLAESVEDEDEVLTALGDELGNFVEYVGGPEFGHVLLSPLENLATIEEPLVRDKVGYGTTYT
jgi:serine/threonine-protein phosphatase 2A regulatory subunit A